MGRRTRNVVVSEADAIVMLIEISFVDVLPSGQVMECTMGLGRGGKGDDWGVRRGGNVQGVEAVGKE